MNLDKTVCYCMNITNRKIKEAVASGANSLEEIQKGTKACTVCKKCRDNVQHLIDYFVSGEDE